MKSKFYLVLRKFVKALVALQLSSVTENFLNFSNCDGSNSEDMEHLFYVNILNKIRIYVRAWASDYQATFRLHEYSSIYSCTHLSIHCSCIQIRSLVSGLISVRWK